MTFLDGKMDPYFTLLIPYAPPKLRTEWHPTESTGPFKTLSRGNFKTYDLAIAWGRENLGGCPYTVCRVDEDGEMNKNWSFDQSA